MGVQKSTLVISAEILSVKAGDNICFMSSFSFENTTSTMEPSMNNQNSYSFFWTLRDSNEHCLCAHNSPCFVIQCFICSFCSSNNSLETGESCIINPHCISVIWMWHPPQKSIHLVISDSYSILTLETQILFVCQELKIQSSGPKAVCYLGIYISWKLTL